MLVYIDDILITGNQSAIIFSFVTQLRSTFAMKDLGDLGYFLSMQAHRGSTSLHLQQSKYVLDLLHRAKMIGCKPYATPCVSGSKLSAFDDTLLSEAETSTYRQLVGALQYCTITRPNLAFFVNQLCQFIDHPTSSHWTLK